MISISNIERFATHDGPGIRTAIFFKGCSLHCPWCANPETWCIQPVLMHDTKKCVSCLSCQMACPTHSLKITDEFNWNSNTCLKCGKCVSTCLENALEFSGQDMSVQEIVEEVLKDKDYYITSNGGVTISGGECFVQFDGLKKLLQALKNEGLHVALETTGNYSLDKLKEVIDYVDLFLFDVKHIDSNKLYEITGGNLDLILSNLTYLSKNCPEKVIIRVPVIPNFNYEKEVLFKIIELASKFNFCEVNLLPYHNLGKSKWDKMHKKYELSDLKMMDKSQLSEYIEIGNTYNVKVKIGG